MAGKIIHADDKGLTLVELLVTLAILCLVLSIVYPVINLNNKATASQLKESAQRTEVRAASGFLTNDIRYSRDVSSDGQTRLTVKDKNNVTVQYYMDADGEGKTFLARKINGGVTEFREIKNAGFVIKNGAKLVEVTLVTDIENNKHTDFKVNRLLPGLTEDWRDIQPPGETFDEFIRNKNIFVFGNDIEVINKAVSGPDATVCIRHSLTLGTDGRLITTKKIYVNGNINLLGSAEIGSNDSEIYVNGNVTIEGGGRGGIYGKLYYTGELNVPSWITLAAVKQKVSSIEFPDFDIPPLRDAAWYAENGYSSTAPTRDNMRFFGNSYSTQSGGLSGSNVIIVSKGDISISNNARFTGIFFAPNGTVTIQGSSTFTGIIVAKKVVISNNATVTFKSVDEFDELPFGLE
jgi:prepilin-type N-terminal cleavage/methylation domain-containing protein